MTNHPRRAAVAAARKAAPFAYIIREHSGRYATLVKPRVPEHVDDATETRTEYTAYRGLLCRHWILPGLGSQHQEVGSGLRPAGGTIPVADGADIAKIVQREVFHGLGYGPPIQEG